MPFAFYFQLCLVKFHYNYKKLFLFIMNQGKKKYSMKLSLQKIALLTPIKCVLTFLLYLIHGLALAAPLAPGYESHWNFNGGGGSTTWHTHDVEAFLKWYEQPSD